MPENNDNGDKKSRADALLERAREACNRNDFDAATEICTEAISLGLENADVYHIRGSAYNEKGEHDHALADLNKAIDLKPDHAKAYNNRGIIYNRRGMHDLAITDYNKAIEINPDFANPYNGRGIVHVARERFDLAIVDFNKAIELKPDYVQAYHNRALAMAQKDAQKTAEGYKRRYEERLTAALEEKEKELAEAREKAFGIIDRQAMAEYYRERAKQYEDKVAAQKPATKKYAEALPKRLVKYFLAFAALYFLLLCLVMLCGLLIGSLGGVKGGTGIPLGATLFIPLTFGIALIAYPLISELRLLRKTDLLNEVCAEDCHRKAFIALYMFGLADEKRRDEAIAEFQKHLGDKSAAEFLSGWEKSAKGDGKALWKNIIKNNPASSVAEDD